MSRRTVFEGRLISVVVEDGKEIVVHGPVATVVAVDADDRVVLVRQDRLPAGGPVLELPAGGIEAGESPLEAARRELREETGLRGGAWVEAATFFSTPGYCDERIHLFLATGLEEGEAAPEAGEELEIVRVPRAKLPGLIAEVEDGKTLAGLLLLLRDRA